ncbi:hypothetical protein OESDEN_05359 [Oesophagostomum dentatum]|uniref:Uncharacterized protein n=1 Tax=Oesophagostomum dentatum TaxID=61180 RepID=A0A0B1TF38_OESDE|nr:hypothetical protein OESDEN_05359 [Oesophagostomum dentatum]
MLTEILKEFKFVNSLKCDVERKGQVEAGQTASRFGSIEIINACTRQASFRVSIDGTMTTATCNASGADPKDRCSGCCQSRALAAGLTAVDGAGFPSNNGRECICCFYNPCK